MYAALNLGYKPREFSDLPLKEKAFLIACIDEKISAEKKEYDKIKK